MNASAPLQDDAQSVSGQKDEGLRVNWQIDSEDFADVLVRLMTREDMQAAVGEFREEGYFSSTFLMIESLGRHFETFKHVNGKLQARSSNKNSELAI